jgi:hypothetical protein
MACAYKVKASCKHEDRGRSLGNPGQSLRPQALHALQGRIDNCVHLESHRLNIESVEPVKSVHLRVNYILIWRAV